MSNFARDAEVNKRQTARFQFQKSNQRDEENDEEKDLIQIEEADDDVELPSHDDYREEEEYNDIDEDDLDDHPNQTAHKNKWRRSRGAKSDKNNSLNKAKTASTTKSNPQSIERPQSVSETMRREQCERQIDMFCEYVHILMHCFLYKLNYYNKKSHFDKLIKYNTIVYVIPSSSSLFCHLLFARAKREILFFFLKFC
jgi:hypothetical protein